MSKTQLPKAPKQRRRRPNWANEGGNKPEPVDGSEERYHSRTIERALDVLETFDPNHASLSLKEISRIRKLPESTLFRILLTLQKRGYLEQHPDGTYQLSRKVLFGKLIEGAEHLRVLARPILEEIASEFNETASLAYLFEDHIQILDTVETFHPVRVTNRCGRILPPHCSSLGKAIVAFQPADLADRMLEAYGLNKRTEFSISDRSLLRLELERVRKSGFAVDREESTLGGICIGAPITAANGRVRAAISVSTPVARLPKEKEALIQAAVMAAAKTISGKLQKLA
ncbi:MAG TPA: IclR family transcriptional regulator [Acidobacteriaceae bacterium]|nr:IclR family transcriptional regulator [Acidobacteriaceae bacterium]